MTWLHLLTILFSATAAALAALAGLATYVRQPARSRGSVFADATPDCVFLFDHRELVDATVAGRALLASRGTMGDAWQRLQAFLLPHFPGFEDEFARLQDIGRFTLASPGPKPLTLRAEWRGGLARIALFDDERAPQPDLADALSYRAMESEIEVLRRTMDHAPILVWREAADGAVTWANRGYLQLAVASGAAEEGLSWPLPRIFAQLPIGRLANAGGRHRAALTVPEKGQKHWYECHAYAQGDEHLVFALPADTAVQAETSLRSFIQTMTKTFAHLTVGLAIFDRQRQLALFNPALIELTGLSPEFLSARPTLFACLDAMRERRTIPEPKDYKAWRNEIAALEREASAGQYEETWSLPNGHTYRVTGRPHPEGAVAFLFEDISAETSRTRLYRAEMELSQAVIDNVDEAIAVFSPAGVLILQNAAYGQLWGDRPAGAGQEVGIAEAARRWQERTAPSPIWAEAEGFVGRLGARQVWSAQARMSDGRLIACRFVPLTGGATLIGFNPVSGAGLTKADRDPPLSNGSGNGKGGRRIA